MTRQQAAAKARAVRAAKRAQAQTNGHITLELTGDQAMGLYDVLEEMDDPRAGAIRRQLVERAVGRVG